MSPRILLALPLLAAACGGPDPAAFDARMGSFVGQPESALLAGLGVPSRSIEEGDRRLLQYDYLQPAPGPAVIPSIGFGFGSFGYGSGVGVGTGLGFVGGGAPPYACSAVFETREGVVRGYARRGDRCAPPTG